MYFQHENPNMYIVQYFEINVNFLRFLFDYGIGLFRKLLHYTVNFSVGAKCKENIMKIWKKRKLNQQLFEYVCNA